MPKLKQRIAGKSVPIEKFAVCKAKRYSTQGGRLTLPGLVSNYIYWLFYCLLKNHNVTFFTKEFSNKTKYTLHFHQRNFCIYLLRPNLATTILNFMIRTWGGGLVFCIYFCFSPLKDIYGISFLVATF